MKYIIALTIICLTSFSIYSQNITVKVIDSKTGNPVQFASIKTGKHSGVISNEEGYFTIRTEDEKLESLAISCLGYQNKTISIQKIRDLDFIINLEQAINQLDEVYISNKAPNADSIITKVKSKLAINYSNNLNKYTIFRRATTNIDFKNLEFEIEKASHVKKKNLESANDNLKALSKKIRESNMVQFKDFNGEFYALNKDSSKIVVTKRHNYLILKTIFQ